MLLALAIMDMLLELLIIPDQLAFRLLESLLSNGVHPLFWVHDQYIDIV